ncbi:MAG TPA: phosphatidylserine decarboxylase family protein [Desulfobacterales bacterium]|jgi:phosphatidylserine decarboxylase|nr:phosphatidylserine decarboxylase family protein [Desulfobacterales bacterium]
MIRSEPSGLASQRSRPIAREGYPFILASAFATATVAILGLYMLALFFLAVTLFVCFFFRDPERVIPEEEKAVVSPADGKVVEVGVVEGSDFAPEKMLKIGIFMSIFNVHVNRIPHNGTVSDVVYHPGKFFSANLDKASRDNERNAVSLEIGSGRRLIVVQVAGLIARRIICKIGKGDRLSRGERFGMICFGSRLDVYFPADSASAVSVGDKVLAGTSVLGHLS